jgi:hypothetical protein
MNATEDDDDEEELKEGNDDVSRDETLTRSNNYGGRDSPDFNRQYDDLTISNTVISNVDATYRSNL